MSNMLISLESSEVGNRCPNNFCLSIFQEKSFEEYNNPIFFQNSLEQYIDNKHSFFNQSNYLSMHFTSQQQIEALLNDVNMPQLEEFIKKNSQNFHIVKPKIKNTAAIRDYKKNICRNILRHSIRALQSIESLQFLKKSIKSQQELDDFINHFSKQLELYSGFRILKKQLQQNDNESIINQERKNIFANYLRWFIDQRASIYIVRGEAENMKEYLRYKNEVLMFYIRNIDSWYSNKPLWRQNGQKNIQIKKKKITKQLKQMAQKQQQSETKVEE